jgi:hypothetical protein
VLEGIEDRHWPMVKQIVAEVHDIDGRVDKMVALLRKQGFKHIVTLAGAPPFFMVCKRVMFCSMCLRRPRNVRCPSDASLKTDSTQHLLSLLTHSLPHAKCAS